MADDDSDDRMLFENAYTDRVDVVMLPSVENGVEVIKSLNNIKEDDDLPDLIILDQNMPLLNGKQTLTYIKSNERYGRIPVCICSTYADNSLVDDCARLGAYMVATKPITERDYHRMMDDFLSFFEKGHSHSYKSR